MFFPNPSRCRCLVWWFLSQRLPGSTYLGWYECSLKTDWLPDLMALLMLLKSATNVGKYLGCQKVNVEQPLMIPEGPVLHQCITMLGAFHNDPHMRQL